MSRVFVPYRGAVRNRVFGFAPGSDDVYAEPDQASADNGSILPLAKRYSTAPKSWRKRKLTGLL